MDVSMWVGQRAYIEVLDDGPGQVAFDRVVFSDDGPPPEDANPLIAALLHNPANQSLAAVTDAYRRLVDSILDQWSKGTLDAQPDTWARIDLLNNVLAAAAPVAFGKSVRTKMTLLGGVGQ